LDEATGCKGDNDPIDVLEIGYRVREKNNCSNVFHINYLIHHIINIEKNICTYIGCKAR